MFDCIAVIRQTRFKSAISFIAIISGVVAALSACGGSARQSSATESPLQHSSTTTASVDGWNLVSTGTDNRVKWFYYEKAHSDPLCRSVRFEPRMVSRLASPPGVELNEAQGHVACVERANVSSVTDRL